MLSREKPKLFLNAKFWISKDTAGFSKVFLKTDAMFCKVLHSKTDLVFHARHVNAQDSIFVKNPSILHSFFTLLLRLVKLRTRLHCDMIPPSPTPSSLPPLFFSNRWWQRGLDDFRSPLLLVTTKQKVKFWIWISKIIIQTTMKETIRR